MVYACIMTDTKLSRAFGNGYRILRLFLNNPNIEINLAKASESIQISKMTLYRTLENLVDAGILTSRSDNYRRFYKLIDTPLIESLKIIYNIDTPVIADILKNFKSGSKMIILYGSRANGTNRKDSDWDILIVSDKLDLISINKKISELEAKHDCQINVKLYSTIEYKEMKMERSSFYQEVISNKYLLKGDLNET